MKWRRLFVAAMFAGSYLTLGAQSGDLKFEVASVKPNKSGDGPIEMGTQPVGRLTMVNVPFQPMIRSLLAERFHLVVHRETRPLPVYALQQVRADGRLGPQLHLSSADCVAIAASRQATPSADARPQCGVRANGGHMVAGGLPLAQLATLLSTLVDRVVVDRTGLTGTFDFELNWTPDRAPQRPDASASSSPDNPSIFTALREQLGLKLESSKAATDVFVIDHVEQPTRD